MYGSCSEDQWLGHHGLVVGGYKHGQFVVNIGYIKVVNRIMIISGG